MKFISKVSSLIITKPAKLESTKDENACNYVIKN